MEQFARLWYGMVAMKVFTIALLKRHVSGSAQYSFGNLLELRTSSTGSLQRLGGLPCLRLPVVAIHIFY